MHDKYFQNTNFIFMIAYVFNISMVGFFSANLKSSSELFTLLTYTCVCDRFSCTPEWVCPQIQMWDGSFLIHAGTNTITHKHSSESHHLSSCKPLMLIWSLVIKVHLSEYVLFFPRKCMYVLFPFLCFNTEYCQKVIIVYLTMFTKHYWNHSNQLLPTFLSKFYH